MILSVSMPLIFWTKMNDIRFALWLFSSAGRLRKNHSPKPVKLTVCLTTPFSPLYLVAQKCGGQTLSLDGALPPNETRSLGFTSIAGACHFVWLSLFFPFFAGRSSG
ncbi:hypothetical protein J4731_21415 [Providencia rettgeri]|nr:hypothetical protein [Providencia rettgeri]